MNLKKNASSIIFALYICLIAASCQRSTDIPGNTNPPPPPPPTGELLPPPIPPAGKLYVGAFCNQLQDIDNPRDPVQMAASVFALERDLGHPLSIITHYYSANTTVNDTVLASDAKYGRIPIITLTSGGDADGTLAGERDAMFIERAKDFKKYGKPVFLRYFTAMNRPGINGRHDKDLGYVAGQSPEIDSLRADKYVKLWRYVHAIFKAQGATNVAWVWSVGDEKSKWDDYAKPYYPGNDYVDWIGLNGYNQHDDTDAKFTERFAPFFNYWLAQTGKPLMMTETGGPTNTQSQANWLNEAHANIQARIPGLKALNYFNSIGSLNNFFLTGNGLQAFINMANDPAFSYRP